MASDSEIRAWAVEHGIHVSSKGRVSEAVRNAHRAAHNGEAAPVPDYPDGMTDADFDVAEAELPDDLPDDMAEVPPRAVTPKASSRTTVTRLNPWSRRGKTAASKSKAKAKARPRVSTAELFGSAWRIGAKLTQPLPPLYRVMRLQSVIAGPLAEDAIKGTVVDPFIQPFARLSQAGKTVTALVAPDLAIGAMAWHLKQTEGQPNPVVMQACQEMLRHGLMAMMDIGGDAFAAQMAKEREQEERYGGDIDQIMMWILSEPGDPAAEEAMMATMAARFAGEDMPEPEPAAV